MPSPENPTSVENNGGSQSLVRRRYESLNWWQRAGYALGALSLTGLVLTGRTVVLNNEHNHPKPPAGFQPGLATATMPSQEISPSSSPTTAATSSSPKPSRTVKPTVSPSETPKPVKPGTPISFHFASKQSGAFKDVSLQPMSCPTGCDVVPSNQPNVVNVRLDPPSYYQVYYFTGDQRIIAAHASEIKGVQLAGQWFDEVQPGDTLDMHTSTGNFEYVDVALPEACHMPTKGTDGFAAVAQEAGARAVILLTCGVPDDSKNVVDIFEPVNTPTPKFSC